MSVAYSIVVPVKNERDNIAPLLTELTQVMEQLRKPYEIIYVDDGSNDGTFDQLSSLQPQYPQLRILKFNRNFGQTSAMDAGIRHARAPTVITIDGDLQNDPHDIPRLLEALQPEVQMVCGIRAKRRDNWWRKTQSHIARHIRNWATGDQTVDTGCSLKAFSRSAFEQLKLYDGMHRFLPLLFRLEGFRVTQLSVNHRPRTRGQTKYGFLRRGLRATIDLLGVCWLRARYLNYKIDKEL